MCPFFIDLLPDLEGEETIGRGKKKGMPNKRKSIGSTLFVSPTAFITTQRISRSHFAASTAMVCSIRIFALSLLLSARCSALNIVIAGGTGKIGNALIPKLGDHDVTVLSRNSFLASAPGKVTEVFGYLGESFLSKHPYVKIRDWDGGDLLDIVGSDWVGWQDDALKPADVVIHLVGGYTEQRIMAAERVVRESLRVNPNALQVTVNPVEEDIPMLTPGMSTMKAKRIKDCEDMVKTNCLNSACLRLEVYNMDEALESICKTIAEWKP